MSLQDDIYDVQAALKGKPEADAFERIGEAFNKLEDMNGELLAELRIVRRFREWITADIKCQGGEHD